MADSIGNCRHCNEPLYLSPDGYYINKWNISTCSEYYPPTSNGDEPHELPCKPGDRIELIEMFDEPFPLPAGSRGTVTNITPGIYDKPQIWVEWDFNVSSLMLLEGIDKYNILTGEQASALVSTAVLKCIDCGAEQAKLTGLKCIQCNEEDADIAEVEDALLNFKESIYKHRAERKQING